jgi:hypothetical protein
MDRSNPRSLVKLLYARLKQIGHIITPNVLEGKMADTNMQTINYRVSTKKKYVRLGYIIYTNVKTFSEFPALALPKFAFVVFIARLVSLEPICTVQPAVLIVPHDTTKSMARVPLLQPIRRDNSGPASHFIDRRLPFPADPMICPQHLTDPTPHSHLASDLRSWFTSHCVSLLPTMNKASTCAVRLIKICSRASFFFPDKHRRLRPLALLCGGDGSGTGADRSAAEGLVELFMLRNNIKVFDERR